MTEEDYQNCFIEDRESEMPTSELLRKVFFGKILKKCNNDHFGEAVKTVNISRMHIARISGNPSEVILTLSLKGRYRMLYWYRISITLRRARLFLENTKENLIFNFVSTASVAAIISICKFRLNRKRRSP